MKFVPISKQSKKNQKKYNSLNRLTWGLVNPTTQVHYKKAPRDQRNEDRGKQNADF